MKKWIGAAACMVCLLTGSCMAAGEMTEAAEAGAVSGMEVSGSEVSGSEVSGAEVSETEVSGTEISEDRTGEDTLDILLIGSDRRNDSWYGNSDTMILITVNDSMNQISMVSFMRDLAAAIPGYSTQKMNAANAIGGPDLLIQTLESNFGVDVDHYIEVDFHNVVNIIDMLGGVELEQTDAEVKITNDYIHSLCQDWGLDANEYYISSGTTHLNGLQALAYMRNRYVGNDYERTARQRKVLESLAGGINASDLTGMTRLAVKVLPELDTDISITEMFSLAKVLSNYGEYTLVTDRVPYDDLMSSSGEMLVPVQPATNERLIAAVYGK